MHSEVIQYRKYCTQQRKQQLLFSTDTFCSVLLLCEFVIKSCTVARSLCIGYVPMKFIHINNQLRAGRILKETSNFVIFKWFIKHFIWQNYVKSTVPAPPGSRTLHSASFLWNTLPWMGKGDKLWRNCQKYAFHTH